jgi:hybrid cluster-associated redox disulfide protein
MSGQCVVATGAGRLAVAHCCRASFDENCKSRCCLRRDNEARQSGAQKIGMKKIAPTVDMTVDQVMHRWPATMRVFMDFQLGCVGCPIAPFHSVEDASREHRIDGDAFLAALRSVVG